MEAGRLSGVVHADQEIVVVCEHGGSLQSKTGAETGFQSQSLKAAYYLKKAGYTKGCSKPHSE